LGVRASRHFYLDEPLDNSHKFQIVLGNTYRQRFLEGLGMHLPHFQLATEAARAARISRVTRPSYPFLLDELTDLIIQDWVKWVKFTG
jgi:hypothetical protein